ncbi:MAG: NADH-quinone oxidoreductase subunit NuoG [Pseudomonadota bacterium]
MTELRTIKVDGEEIDVDPSLTLLQACEAAGKEIPRFCYHERLSVAGNCRMCLIEVKGGPPKPVASCAQNVRDLRPGPEGAPPELFTNTPMVKKAREGVMEFLLINHPLDCPICDQGGECDLQDQAMGYGRAGSRFAENKRAVEEKHMGPLIKTIMTRCIQCTRCVRFATEIAGVDDLGLVNRGENAEITTYLEKSVESELTGNLIDICPVGALTSRPYAFNARPWELRKTPTIDVMDAVGSNIRVDARGSEVLRILPRVNDDVNEEWISDKTRFVWDGLRKRRLDRPYVRKDGKLAPVGWDEALAVVADKLKALQPAEMGAIAGDLVSAEAMKALKDLMAGLGSPNLDCRQDGAAIGEGPRASYLFNATIAGVDAADAVLLIGTNPRWEAPLINARLRKLWLHDLNARFGVIGEPVDLSFDYEHLGAGPSTLTELLKGRHSFAKALKAAKRPLIIVGSGALARADGAAILNAAAQLAQSVGAFVAPASSEGEDAAPGWNGFSVLHQAASRVAGLDLSLIPGEGGLAAPAMLDAARAGEVKALYLLGADEADLSGLENTFVVYQGSHGDAGAHAANVILPAATYTEQDGVFVNTEGRAQLARRAAFPVGDAKEDWAILRALSGVMGAALPYDDLTALRGAMMEDAPALASFNTAPAQADSFDPDAIGAAGDLAGAPFEATIADFYLTNPIARASDTMAECSARHWDAKGRAPVAAE